MNSGQPTSTESTPLLVSSSDARVSYTLPSIAEGLDSVQALGVHHFHFVDQPLLNSSTQTAYQLLVLLQWRVTIQHGVFNTKDIWERRDQQAKLSSDLKVLDDRISAIWNNFVQEYRTPKEVQDVLWLQFPVDANSHYFLRVVGTIAHSHDRFLADGLIDLSLQRMWKYGPEADVSSNIPMSQRLLKRYDALGTPRVLHCLDLIGELLLLVALIHFLLYPPAKPIVTGHLQQLGRREYFLTLFPIALSARLWSIRNLSFVLVWFSFVFTLPSVPLPGDTSFVILHIALAVQIMFLHFPHPPSPLFLFPCHRSLPLSVLLTHSMSHMFLPVLLFFLPALLLAALLLSISLADTTLKLSLTAVFDPSPIQTRAVFLILFAVFSLLLLLCLIIGAAKFPSSFKTDQLVIPYGQCWDRYSQRIGLDARRAFVHALVWYSKPYYFPPPLNLLQLLVVRIPWVVFSFFGKKGPSSHLEAVERILWRVTVGPIVGIVAGVWLWNFWK